MSEVCVIAGGTKGLGWALAQESLKNGVRPIIIGRSYPELAEEEVWRGMKHVRMDLSQPELGRIAELASLCTTKLFWVAGNFLRKNITRVLPSDFWGLVDLHQWALFNFTQTWHKARVAANRPYHLIMIGSTSSYRVRDNEELYCMMQGGKAAFTRNFSRKMHHDLPGSRTLLANPGGMKTELYAETDQDISEFMEPATIAKEIWRILNAQSEPFIEKEMPRDPNRSGQPLIIDGPVVPELPFK